MAIDVNNILRRSDDEDLVPLLTNYIGDDGDLDFNKIVPMPEDLRKTKSPARIVTQEEYDKAASEAEPGAQLPITQEMYDEYMQKYGYADWYTWAIANWGTKWNAGNSAIDEDTPDVISFDTADHPPQPVIQKLSDLLDVSLTLYYISEGHDYVGCTYFNPGYEFWDDEEFTLDEAPKWLLNDVGYEPVDME